MDLIYQGVVAGEITLPRWVEVTSTNPAKMFGLYPQKGAVAPGSDADIVIYDPAAEQTISAATHHMAVDYSCYEGMQIKGRVDTVFSRGRQDHRRRRLHGRDGPRTLRPAPALPGPAIEPRRTMDIGVVLQTDPPASWVIERARQAEQAGFSHVWTYDSCVLWQEPFVIYANILSATSHIQVGPDGHQPGHTRRVGDGLDLRHLERHVRQQDRLRHRARRLGAAGHRAQADLDAAPSPRRSRTSKSSPRAARSILNGVAVKLPWASDSRLPVWGAGYGPKALQVIGERADGLILQVADPDIARWTIESVRAAARAAGRDPDALTICVAAPAYVGSDLAHQREQLRWFGGMVGNHVADLVARYGESSEVPRALTDYVRDRQGYDYSHHGRAGNPSVDFVPDDIVDRFCLLGPLEAHIDRLAELADIGVDQFALYLMHDNIPETLEAYRARIIPAAAEL